MGASRRRKVCVTFLCINMQDLFSKTFRRITQMSTWYTTYEERLSVLFSLPQSSLSDIHPACPSDCRQLFLLPYSKRPTAQSYRSLRGLYTRRRRTEEPTDGRSKENSAGRTEKGERKRARGEVKQLPLHERTNPRNGITYAAEWRKEGRRPTPASTVTRTGN